jgi:hypothetical protein
MKKVHLPSPAANYCEQLIWSSLQGTELEKDFGQILGISHSGKYLMMERLSDITEEEFKLTQDPPNWLQDVKFSAFGKNAEGEIKLRDYAMFDIGPALASVKKKPAEWQRLAKINRKSIPS